ncbi:MAG TPA: M14 family zinc carboxypeptidase [Thermoanaerobaculia bacterium]|nr:M14 family zinc carboxypeptidase [Thermoanaerobaculia bacterium]
MKQLLAAFSIALLGRAFPLAAAPPESFTAAGLWTAWPSVRVSPSDPWSLRSARLQAVLDTLGRDYPGLFTVVDEGRSGEGRKLTVLSLGSGPLGVLLWSQMHGDEPTATSALLDVLAYLGKNRGSGAVKRLLSGVTLYLLPMLNPDGAERATRRNAQGIDINRDALRLQTPEGRYLKNVRDRFQPAVGYNLHNQEPLTLAGKNGEQVALAVLSVPFDEALTENEGRRTTKRLAVFLRDDLAPWAAGKIARYDADYTARAFGDAMTRWGTATLLIETGGAGAPDEAGTLVRLNFVAILRSLQALADGSLAEVDPKAYDAIPALVREGLFDVLVREARVANGSGLPPYLADVALLRPRSFGGPAGSGHPGVVEMGDLSTFRGKEEIRAKGSVLVPAPPGGEEGWRGTLARLRERKRADEGGNLLLSPEQLSLEVKAWMPEGELLVPGYAGALLILTPAGVGTFRLDRRLEVAPR